MKRVLGVVGALVFLCGSLFSRAIVFEDERYIAIFDRVTMMGDHNFTLVRLYKTNQNLKYELPIPPFSGYAPRVFRALAQFREAAPVEDDDVCKNYMFHVFSTAVDSYMVRYGIPSIWGSQSFPGQKDFVLSLAGEMIFFGDHGAPRETEVGAFQYTLDPRGNCYHRCFARRAQLSGLRVDREIGAFLVNSIERGSMLGSGAWRRELRTLMDQYTKKAGEDFS